MTPSTPSIARLDQAATKTTTRWGEGNRIIWRCWGAGPPLVLLHGDAGSWTHWIRSIQPLAPHFRLIIPDIPGYGQSDSPPADWSPASLAQALAHGLEQIVAAPASYAVAGFSFGGIIAGHLAAIDHRVGRLVVLGPGGLGFPSHHASRGPRRLEPGMDAATRRGVLRHNLTALMLSEASVVDDAAVSLCDNNIKASRLRIGGIPTSNVLAELLPTIRGQFFAIWGGRDAFAHPEVTDRVALLRRLRPDGDVRVIDGAGHWVQYEAADTVNGMLLDMLGTV
jgi:pimeloyl-ACP methyl ester carboxylesterase